MKLLKMGKYKKDYHLVTGGGLGCVNWLKNWIVRGFVFHTIIPPPYPVW